MRRIRTLPATLNTSQSEQVDVRLTTSRIRIPAVAGASEKQRGCRRISPSNSAVTGERQIGNTISGARHDTNSTGCQLAASRIGRAVRARWGIGNGLHEVRDMAFRQDERDVRIDHAAEQLVMRRSIALTVSTWETTFTAGISGTWLMCIWDGICLAKGSTAQCDGPEVSST